MDDGRWTMDDGRQWAVGSGQWAGINKTLNASRSGLVNKPPEGVEQM
ncbi:MAG TPA: hypothetical protein VJ183_01015 [Chloroflexia bacterium]|nr:hypothetical protein [Chloroflexia bacterium]